MKKFLFFITLFGFVMAATPGFAQKKAKKKKKKGKKEKVAEPIVLETATDTISYAFGLVLGNNLYTEEVFDIDLDVLSEGIKEAQKGKAEIFSQEDARDMVNKHIENKRKERLNGPKKKE